MSFNWVLDSAVAQIPTAGSENVALSFDGRDRLTYRELREKSMRYAQGLRDLGLAEGDRLGLLLYNDPEYLPLCFAAMRLGVILVRLNFRLAPTELEFILNDSGSKALIVHSSLLESVEPIRETIDVETFVVLPDSDRELPPWSLPFDVVRDKPVLEKWLDIGDDHGIALIYTSGTTGLPKGALWNHGNTVGTATLQALKWSFSPRTVALVPGPLYHAGGFEAVTAPALLSHGRAVSLPSGNFSIEHLLDVIRAEGVTDCLLFAFMLNDMLRLDDLEDRVPPSLTHLIIGGDTMMPWTVAEVRKRMPQVRLTQVYGLTEGGAISTTLDDDDFDEQSKSVGRPLPMTEAKVINPYGEPAEVGEVGEIVVRGTGVCAGYWRRPEATEATFVDGWCRTGDLGSVNAEGFLSLGGRAKDMIRSGGENIYPAEVERVLTAHPSVQDCAVVAVPDPKYNEVGCAVIVPVPGSEIDEKALREFCRAQMAAYKIPKYFVAQDELPRNASGKILKYRLRERYENVVSEGSRPAGL
ncbi:AMP-binding protein [Saccharopolyspora sp. TS4A08]|uniref:AMP-binding protein n=1 Tax=Saccharopolyspora ipomoeae TaxID=3042027 RepID=A0ABT6PUV8_9PSEU|nr:AMP-binding protein [Saccharopolyspora sp. TS4A08]MDI2031767.1 AMP-binding protein [Saccharopolyspora sp. TS4A08]